MTIALHELREHASPAALRDLRFFRWLAAARLSGAALAPALGGAGGLHVDLATTVVDMAAVSPPAAEAFVAHRLAIETLARAGNVALREHLLPALLTGERAGAWAHGAVVALADRGAAAASADDTGRGFLLTSDEMLSANLACESFVLPVPVRFGEDPAPALLLLSSDQDGIRLSDAAAARLDRVFFREDELLQGEGRALASAVMPLARVLHCASALGFAQHCGELAGNSATADDVRQNLALARRSFLQGLAQPQAWQSDLLVQRARQGGLAQAARALALAPGSDEVAACEERLRHWTRDATAIRDAEPAAIG